MFHAVFHRTPRLAGFWAALDLSLFGRRSANRAPSLPTAARLRRDIGLPELDPQPQIHPFLGRRL